MAIPLSLYMYRINTTLDFSVISDIFKVTIRDRQITLKEGIIKGLRDVSYSHMSMNSKEYELYRIIHFGDF